MDFSKLHQEMQQARLCHVCWQEHADLAPSEHGTPPVPSSGSGSLQASDLEVQGPSEGSDFPWVVSEEVESSDGLYSGPGCEETSTLDVLYSADHPTASITECELLAQELNKQKQYQHEQCEQLLELLTQCSLAKGKPRNMIEVNKGKYLVFGAYSHGGKYGVTTKTQQYPNLVQYLLNYLQHWHGSPIIATSLVVNLPSIGMCIIMRDLSTIFWAWVLTREASCGSNSLERGSTCHQALDNQKVMGTKHDIHGKVVRFHPKAWHGPVAWSGVRMTVGTYVTRGFAQLTSLEVQQLKALGFELPAKSSEQGYAAREVGRLGPHRPLLNKEELRRQIYQLHAATGHGSIISLVNLLKKRNVSPEVIKIAQDFKCSVCAEKAKVQPRHLSSLEALPTEISYCVDGYRALDSSAVS